MSSPTSQTTIVPHSQKPLVTRVYPTESQLDDTIRKASDAQKSWSRVPLKERIAIGTKFMDEFKKLSDEIPLDLTLQMGRPVSQAPGEIRGFLERAKYMLSIAGSSLADVGLEDTDKPGFRRFIRRTPLGVVLVIAPWNFPYLVSINSVLPAIIAGNAVLLKPSPQTPLTAELFANALVKAGVPRDVIQVLHLSPELVTRAVQHPLVDFVSFTGSVGGGRAVEKAAVEASGFKGVALELGGKDPAYVRADADLDYTAAELVDGQYSSFLPNALSDVRTGAFFNSGQSCCAIERIYAHESVFDVLVAKVVAVVEKYKLGDPTKPETTLGPVVSLASAERIRKQVADAVKAGAKPLIDEKRFQTAETCDYLDPALAWTGVKNSGRGISLSKFGYDQLTRAKSVHMKIKTS
ncbi:hypothetical protein EWM64_g1191 [Hericium alpestre]|uniref:Aldehyde dehydrogenase domain-containing protein n=1 Tax=Hericium alpestre TaxID=135208 RepID=A0A4Z0A7V3_9AGAM|nr:hypothetical protein EWM64_g1191 [Hericium alpestre]